MVETAVSFSKGASLYYQCSHIPLCPLETVLPSSLLERTIICTFEAVCVKAATLVLGDQVHRWVPPHSKIALFQVSDHCDNTREKAIEPRHFAHEKIAPHRRKVHLNSSARMRSISGVHHLAPQSPNLRKSLFIYITIDDAS